MSDKADVIVVGMGPGGEDVAGTLAEAGLDVIGVEKQLLGGECPYWGCVPSKMMIRAANLLAEARRIPGMSGAADVKPDWAPVAKRIRDEATDNWDDRVAVERFECKGGRFVRGEAIFSGARSVAVDGREFEAGRGIVIATGTAPVIPPIDGLAGTPYWTNREAIEVEELPSSLLVLGGGAIGLELAQVFARFGVDITVVEALDSLIPIEEPEAGTLLAEIFEREGIRVIVGARVERVGHTDEGFTLTLSDGGELNAERLLVSTGRRADLASLRLDKARLDPGARWVDVDDRMRAAPGLWAVGDVTGKGAFTHVAMYQARIAASDILGRPTEAASYHALPRVTFTDPEVGSVGLSEQQATEEGLDVRVATSRVPSSARGWIHKAGNDGLIKLVADARSGLLVGATSVGPHGGEVLSMLTLAVHARVPVEQLRSMIYAYPTFHRGVEDALRDLET
jgi:pyruvate/2-oxoglutarate dehydrogenase complex dihydrolipoamide dehydrogenase (E3) component